MTGDRIKPVNLKFFGPPRPRKGVDSRTFVGGTRTQREKAKRERLQREIAAIQWP